MKKKFQYFINIFWSEEDRVYIAEIPELEGCLTHGRTPEEAVKNAQNAIESWIQAARKLDHPIPEPVSKKKVSGKFNVRLPKYIHRSLILKAAQEGISLNQLIATLLSRTAAV